MKSQKKKSDLVELISNLAKAMAEKDFFGPRKKLNEELIEYLKNHKISKEFWDDVRRIRKDYDIPKLNPKEDINCFPLDDDYIDCESRWFSSQDEKFKKILQEEINSMINSYEFPENFLDWIQGIILYNQIPPWKPLYNWELPFQIKDIRKTELDTKQKRYLKHFSRRILNIKRRPPKDKIQIYNKIIHLLGFAPKPKRRALQESILNKALHIYERRKHKKEIVENFDPELAERDRGKLKDTYAELVGELYNDEELMKNEAKIIQRSRKQYQRIKERIPKMIDKKKLKK